MPTSPRILLVGGYGVVGSRVAALLRRHHPGLQLVIAGRNRDKAADLARSLGNAEAATVDTTNADPLTALDADVAAIAALVHDRDDNLLRSAIALGLPYLDITRGVAAQTRAFFTASLGHVRAPVMFASNWMAGVPAILAMHLARDLAPIESVTLSILYDMNETIGPDSADAGDTMGEPFMARVDGAWAKVEGLSDPVSVAFPSGRERPTVRVSMADVITLAQATRARDVAVRIGIEPQRENAGPVSHEIIVEVTAAKGSRRIALLDRQGQAHLTAIGVVANLERVLGLNGPPLHAGLSVPETAADGERLMHLLRAEGVALSGDI